MIFRSRDTPLPWAGPAWGAGGLALLAVFAVVLVISPRFLYGSDMLQRPIVPYTVLMMWAGLVWCGVVYLCGRTRYSNGLFLWIVGLGLAYRLLLFPSTPILEDDFYRYLWEGGMTFFGYNAAAYTPFQVQVGHESVPENLVILGEWSGLILERVNHPYLSTVYPLGAQIGFAIAHQIAGFQLWGLKVLYLLADIAALVLLTRILQRLPRSPLWVAVWWWNPLVIEETYNSAHMDILLVPPLLYAVLAAMRHRALPAAIGLAIAVSVKVWPVLLAPPIFWLFRRDPLRMAGACAVFLALCFVCVLPLITVSEAPDDSGFVAYSQRWEMNDALYMVFLWIGDQALQLFGHDAEKQTLHYIARAIAVGIIGIVIAYVLRYRTQPNQLMGSAAAITGALFLVSPTQFPWYYVWILPFLCAAPRPSLLALTVMLPMYFLKFHYAARDNEFFFHYRLVWVEYAPVFFLLGMEAWSAVNTRRGRSNALA